MQHRHPVVQTLATTVILLGLLGRYVRSAEPDAPLFSFGVMADVQYADLPTAGKRDYRASLASLEKCVEDFRRRSLAFVIQLGDCINGNDTEDRTRADLDRVLQTLQPLDGKLRHAVGNHCLNAGREYLLAKLGLPRSYYDFVPDGVEGWRMVVLDGNDAGYGAMSPEQLAWVRQTLERAESRDERVLVFSHFAVAPEAAAHHRLNEPEPLKEILARSPCVVAYLAGHDHSGGYAEKDGVYHVTLQGMVESPAQNAYAVVHVYPDRLELEGIGAVPSRKMPIRELAVK